MNRYIPLILIEGATVMAVELCGAKMLAPLYGGSLFVWAAILAVTLGALAFGYYYGGVLSGKEEPKKKLFNVILVACIFILLMPFLRLYVLPPLTFINFKLAVILSASILIFAPIFFLGCTTPLLVSLNTNRAQEAGMISGKIYAISTVGGIVSTLLCGFCLIPVFGLKLTLACFAILLFICALLILKIFKAKPVASFAIALMVCIKTLSGYDDANISYFSYGMMGDVAVMENKKENVRSLLINRTIQTEMNVGSGRSVSNYVSVIDSLVERYKVNGGNALVLGLGGGLLSNSICEKNYNVDAVEFDPRIIEVAKNYFNLNERVRCFNMDARAYMNKLPFAEWKYDVVIMDLFKAEEQPVHAITKESLENLKSPPVLIINWHGYLDGELGKGTQILLNTLHAAKFNTWVIPGPGGEDYRNTVIFCTPSENEAVDPLIAINTDDLPVLELANAKANLRWRQNYLRYYQQAN